MLSSLIIIAKHMFVVMNSGLLFVAAHLCVCRSPFRTHFCATTVQIKQVVSLPKCVQPPRSVCAYWNKEVLLIFCTLNAYATAHIGSSRVL